MPDRYVVFSHGKESGPWGSKIAAMSEIARGEGFHVESVDYQGIDDPHARVTRLLANLAQCPEKRQPPTDPAGVRHHARPIGIVQTQYRCLRQGVRRSDACWMLRVPFDLRGPPQMTLYQHALGESAKWHRRGEEQRLARHEVFGHSHIRHDIFVCRDGDLERFALRDGDLEAILHLNTIEILHLEIFCSHVC